MKIVIQNNIDSSFLFKMVSLLKCFDLDSQAYLNKLRLEIKSLNLLTSKILSKIEDNPEIEDSPNTSRLAVTDSSAISVSVEEIYNDFKKYLLALIEYSDSKEDLQYHFALPSIISAPKFCQLPSLCNMLWRRIEILTKRSHTKSTVSTTACFKESERVSVSFKSSQTELGSLLYCESCYLSTEFIKSLVHLIIDAQKKHNIVECNVSKTRERVRSEVFEMSQWGVMKEWTTAIRKDIEWLLSLTVSVIKKFNKLNEDQEAMREEHNRNTKILQNDLDLTRKQLEAEIAQKNLLNQQIENLDLTLKRKTKQEKKLQRIIQECKEKFKLFHESLMLIRDDCKQIKKSQRTLSAFLKHNLIIQSRHISDLKDDIDCFIKKTEKYFIEALLKEANKLKTLQKNVDEKDLVLSDFKTNISELQSEKQQLKEKLRILTNQRNIQENELRNIREKVIELEKLLEEIQAREDHKECHTVIAANKNLKVSGDPLSDMENQRRINKQNIKALLKENAKLKTTISKLKKLRTEDFESNKEVR